MGLKYKKLRRRRNSVITDRGPGGPVVRVIVLRLNCVTEPRVTTSLTRRQITDPHTHMYTYIQTYHSLRGSAALL